MERAEIPFRMNGMKRTAGLWLLIGLIGYALLPWYLVGDPGF